MKYLIQPMILSLIVTLLTACTYCEQQKMLQHQPKGYGELCSKAKQCELLTQLKERKVKAVFFGDRLYITFSSEQLFKDRSVNFVKNAPQLLSLIGQYLSCYQTMMVGISVYTDVMPTQKENAALATEQAQQITRYLWKQGIDSRLVYGNGQGASLRGHGQFGKRYVQIQTERLP